MSSFTAKEGNSIPLNLNFSSRCKLCCPLNNIPQILRGLTLKIAAGQTLAIVGPSGSGKSTVIQLLQRLYDPISGMVKIDGIPVTDYNIQYLRGHYGIVGQEPVLFAGTIKENIKFGNRDATDGDVLNAARVANCFNFIMKFPKGFETLIGERGAQLSGGQKQRIAIARAIVKNPRVLLLDEATSALDVASERVVQTALEKAGKGRTTIVVSHRLSTITDADVIVFMDRGVMVERGSHSELMAKQGRYYSLVRANQKHEEEAKMNLKRRKTIQTDQGRKEIEVEVDDDDVEDELPPDEPEENDQEQVKQMAIAAEEKLSLRKRAEEKLKRLKTVSSSKGNTLIKLIRMNALEWPLILGGCVAGVVNGATLPLFAILFGDFFGILELPNSEEVKQKSITYAIAFSALGVMAGCSSFLQTFLLSKSGVLLTARLRKKCFQAILRQEMAWFDVPENSVGALTVRLSGDCANVQAATGSRLGSLIQSFSMLMIGFGVSLFYSWKLTMVVGCSMPLVLVALIVDARYSEASMVAEKSALQKASNIAVEAISNIRTVAGLCLESFVIRRYNADVMEVEKMCLRKSKFRGLIYATGLSMPLFVYGPAFYYGAVLVIQGLHYQNILK